MSALDAAESLTSPTGSALGVEDVDLRAAYAQHYVRLLTEHMRTINALSGVMVAALERADLDEFAALGSAFQSAVHAAGAASATLAHLGSSEGIA